KRGLEVGTVDGWRLVRQRVLVPSRRQLWLAAWSPRGRVIAYVEEARRGDIHLVRVSDGKVLRRLTYSPEGAFAQDPAWSPDGGPVPDWECPHYEATCQIRLRAADGSHKRRLVVPQPPLRALQPVWSPDGSRLAYDICDARLCRPYILDVRTGRRTRTFGLG